MSNNSKVEARSSARTTNVQDAVTSLQGHNSWVIVVLHAKGFDIRHLSSYISPEVPANSKTSHSPLTGKGLQWGQRIGLSVYKST